MASFSDDFNRPNENLEASPDWTIQSGATTAAQAINNACRCNTTDSVGTAYRSPDLGSADHKTQVLFVNGGTQAQPFITVRQTDANNYIGFRWRDVSGGTLEFYKRVSGTFTLLGSAGSQGNPPMTVRLEANGNNLELFNGSTSVASASDSFNNTVTTQGINARALLLDPWFDDYLAETFAAAGATVNLSGASGTGQAGNINSIGAALLTLAGTSASGQAGTITVTTTSGATITLSGVSGTGDAGLLSATGAALLTATGAQGTGQSGILSATGGALSGLTGVSSEGQPGTVTIQVAGGVSITLSGTQSTGQAGTLTTITGASFALSGVASTGQAGTLTVATVEGATVTLTGVQAAGGAGDLSVLTGATVNLSGAVGTGQSGAVTVTIPGTITIDLTFKTALILSAEDTSLTLQ